VILGNEKILNSLKWGFLDSIISQGFQFFIGIVLARILSPMEFGLIGMLTIFISISQVFIDSGLSSALVKKLKCLPEDYSTVFIYNLLTSIIFYIIIFNSSKLISIFFSEPQLIPLLKVLGIGFVLNALSAIHRTILIKNLSFKVLTMISFFSSIIAGYVSILMALNGFGVYCRRRNLRILNIRNFFIKNIDFRTSIFF
jgi:teichuronic acid exporter